MKATDFEIRHQTLVHQFIVAAALLTYFVDREYIVWRFVKDSSAPRGLERFCFHRRDSIHCCWGRNLYMGAFTVGPRERLA
jgi:hypothetical protein